MAHRDGPLLRGQRSLLVTALQARGLGSDGEPIQSTVGAVQSTAEPIQSTVGAAQSTAEPGQNSAEDGESVQSTVTQTVSVAMGVEGAEGWVHAEGKRRTSAAAVGNCGVGAAMWYKLAGESVTFVPHTDHCKTLLPPPRALHVEILTEQEETLGTCEILLEELSGSADWSTVGWYGLRTPFGRNACELRLFIRWGSNRGRDGDRTQYKGTTFRPSGRQFYLHTTVMHASGLVRPTATALQAEAEPDLGTEGAETQPAGERSSADASEVLATYAAFFVEGFDVPLYSRRSTTSKGGVEVDWGPNGDGVLLVAPFELPQPPPTLAVELLDATRDLDDASKHLLIARGACDVGHALARWNAERTLGAGSWTADEWVELTDGDGKPAGTLLVRMMWQPTEVEEEEEHGLVRALRDELNTLSTGQLLSRLKTELGSTTQDEGGDHMDAIVKQFELDAGRGALDRSSAQSLLIKHKIARVLEVQTAGEARQRSLFVSVLECSGLHHPDDEEVYVKVMCAGESRETDAVKHSSGRPVWRHGAGQTLAFIDTQQQGVTPEGSSTASRKWAVARWVHEAIAESRRQDASTATKIKNFFRSIDEDDSGNLDIGEFKKAMLAVGVEMDEATTKDVFRHIDEDCGGTIAEDEFVQWWLKQQLLKSVTGATTDLFARFEASATMDMLARLSGRDEESSWAGYKVQGALKAIASGTVLPTKVRINVFSRSTHDNGANQETLLGAADISLDDPRGICLTAEEDCVHNGWFSLGTSVGKEWDTVRRRYGRQKEIGGKIRLTFRWSHAIAAGKGKPWQLDATVFEAVNLRKAALLTDLNTVGSNSPFVRFRVEDFDEQTFRRQPVSLKTSTVTRGGSQPKWGVGCGAAEKWNQVMGESVQFHLADAPPSLGIELWNDDPAGDTLIGLHLLEIGSNAMTIQGRAGHWDSGVVWCDLHHPKTGASAGKVQVQVSWHRNTVNEKKPYVSLRVERAAQTVHLLQDQYAHGGSYDTRTVLYTPGDVNSLLSEADLRFQRHLVLYRQVPSLEPHHEEADEELRKRVAYETTERWVELVSDVQQDPGDTTSTSVWQKWVGSVQTTEVVRRRRGKPPAAAETRVEVLLAAVKSEDDLIAFLAGGTNRPLWAVDAKTQAGSRMSLGSEAAAIRLQAAIRARRARKETAVMRNQVVTLQALARSRKARTMIARRRRRRQAMSAEAELQTATQVFAEQMSRASKLLAGMNSLATEIQIVADKNEDSLRGTAGWAVFSKATEEAAEALMQTHRKELDRCVLASEMEALLGRYQASHLCKQDVVAETQVRIKAAKSAETRALKQLQTQVATLVKQMDELAQETEAMGKNGWRRRREPMYLLLQQAQQAIDEATASKIVPEKALLEARKHRERKRKEEQDRIVAEDAAKLAGEKCLDAAFAQTMRFLFSPSRNGSLADGLTAADRRLQSEETEAEKLQRAKQSWRSYNTPELLRDGKKLGVFVDNWRHGIPELEHRPDRLIRSAPTNEYISASYEKMIFERYPEERGSRYQLMLERRRKQDEDDMRQLEQEKLEKARAEHERKAAAKLAMKYVKVTGGEWTGEVCRVLKEHGDNITVELDNQQYTVSTTGRGGIVISDAEQPVEVANALTPRKVTQRQRSPTSEQERLDSANDPFQRLLPSKRSEQRSVHPLLGTLPSEPEGRTPSRRPTPGTTTPISRDRLGFTPSTSAGSQIAARDEFLEGWVQFGVRSLRSGEPLPALSGVNPSRLAALQAAKAKRSVRKAVRSAGAIDSLSGQRATPTARLNFSDISSDEPLPRPV